MIKILKLSYMHQELHYHLMHHQTVFKPSNVHVCLCTAPSQPYDLTVNSHMNNATILNVSWAAPLCDNGVRIQYSVSFCYIHMNVTVMYKSFVRATLEFDQNRCML